MTLGDITCPYCQPDTGGNHGNTCPMNPGNVLLQNQQLNTFPTGWRCPVCGIVNSPWVMTCPNNHGSPSFQVDCFNASEET